MHELTRRSPNHRLERRSHGPYGRSRCHFTFSAPRNDASLRGEFSANRGVRDLSERERAIKRSLSLLQPLALQPIREGTLLRMVASEMAAFGALHQRANKNAIHAILFIVVVDKKAMVAKISYNKDFSDRGSKDILSESWHRGGYNALSGVS